MKLTSTVLDCRNALELATFYHQLLGWPIRADESDWVTLRPTDGGAGISFAGEAGYVPPVWPSAAGAQQMQMHLDIEVDDLDVGCAQALEAGAVLAAFQPQEDVRVFLDPAGHPFCLWIAT